MLGKQAWRISQQPSSLLSQLMKGLYYPQGDFWQAGKGSRPSWGWQSIVLGRDSITPQVMWAVGNGQSILIREDKWLRSGIIGGPAARNEPHKVEALIEHRDGKWKESMLRTMFDDQRVKEILETPIGLPSTADKRVWMNNKSGDYSVKSGYIHIRNQTANTLHTTTSSSHQTKPDLWKFIWQSNTLPRVKQFLWNACQNALPIVENLHKRRIVHDPICPICKKEAETTEHALMLCPWTIQLWRASPLQVKISMIGLTRVDEWIRSQKEDPNRDRDINLIATAMWCIWKDRNRFVF